MQGFENGRGGFRGGPPGRGFRGNQGFGQGFGGPQFGNMDGPRFGNRGGPRFGQRGFGPRGGAPDGPGPQFRPNGPGPRFGGMGPNSGFGPRFGSMNEANGQPGPSWNDDSAEFEGPGFGSGPRESRASSGRRSMGFGEGDGPEVKRNDRSRSRSRTEDNSGTLKNMRGCSEMTSHDQADCMFKGAITNTSFSKMRPLSPFIIAYNSDFITRHKLARPPGPL